ncbi:hypothetical protein NYZ99_13820 [Maribacter litopenaei]|uniref:Response regulatory domain-containing protein n=1 Tax=Maribacter litopenaei TaxID=2976127 RepID=A0ABY5Y521_9FLAO|nr:hypothetical protein [Maribacter litopenaei]UWX54103.1 hypothetical protein NYZ99_13820 [Maribacter litopenaei]
MKKIKFIGIVDDDPITVFGIRKMLNLVVECETIEAYKNGKIAFDSLRKKYLEDQDIPRSHFFGYQYAHNGWMAIFRRVP